MKRNLTILLHSSKTMKSPGGGAEAPPILLPQAVELATLLKKLSAKELAAAMHISLSLAVKTQDMLAAWNTEPAHQSPAMDSFVGDIYSGLQARTFTTSQRQYANQHLRILSGLYGILRPLDGIMPYRLEMAYKIPGATFASLYDFWGKSIAETLPVDSCVVNVSSEEYTKAVLPYIRGTQGINIITPRFLTIDPATQEPSFKVVHAKIARGAFARWLIVTQATDPATFKNFAEIGYAYNQELSTLAEPVFVCQKFGGIGLSMRLAQ